MRSLVVAVLLTGCGRLGFDDVAPLEGPMTPELCDVRTVGTLALDQAAPTQVRAVKLAATYAVAVETASTSKVHVVRVSHAGDLISQHLPFPGGYLLQGISEIADRPFVYVFTAGAGFIKMLTPDWSTYDTGPSGDELAMDPQQALLPDRTTAIYGVFTGGTLAMRTIDATGATFLDGDYAPAAEFASFTSTPSGARVVVASGGRCETFAVLPDGVTKDKHTFAPCFEPRVAAIDDDHGAVLHRISEGGAYAVHAIPADATKPGETVAIEPGSNGRISVVDGTVWVAYRRTTGEARMISFDGQITTNRDFPAVEGAFELLGDRAFWVAPGGSLRVGTPCMQ